MFNKTRLDIDIEQTIAVLMDRISVNNTAKGFRDKPRTVGDGLMLIVTELAEAFEGFRHGNPPSEHIPEFSAMEEELADVFIRILDEAAVQNCRLGAAVLAKMAFNASRPHMHGGKAL